MVDVKKIIISFLMDPSVSEKIADEISIFVRGPQVAGTLKVSCKTVHSSLPVVSQELVGEKGEVLKTSHPQLRVLISGEIDPDQAADIRELIFRTPNVRNFFLKRGFILTDSNGNVR